MDSSGNIREIETDMSMEDWENYVDNSREEQLLDVYKNRLTALKGNEIPLKESEAKELKRMSKPRRKNWMRNKPCPCGSGKKMKKCCWSVMTLTAKPE